MDINTKLSDQITKILSSLANEDSIKIFLACKEGIERSSKTIKELGLTQKRYYTWLNRLIDAGLVEKVGNVYVQTVMGEYCNKLGRTLLNVVSQRDRLELASKLMKAEILSMAEKEKILGLISKESLFGTASVADIIHEVKMITEYNTFIDEVTNLLDSVKEAAYIAAGRSDLRVIDAVLRVIERKANLFFLSRKRDFSEMETQILRVLLSPILIKIVRKLISSKELNFRVTKDLAYSFIIVDDEFGLVELPHPASHDFFFAFKFKNALFCQKLIDTFNHLYEKGEEDPRIKSLKRYMRLFK